MITVIVGAPCSGKSTYARGAAKDGEPVVDYDRLAAALGAKLAHGSTGAIRSTALSAREGAIGRILRGVEADAWVIHTSPSASRIEKYVELEAKFLLLDPGKEACIERAKADGRPDETIEAIEQWYESPPKLPEGTEIVTAEPEKKMRGAMKIEGIAASMVAAVKGYVAKAEVALTARLDALEARVKALPAPEKGDRGDDADMEAVARLVDERLAAVNAYVAERDAALIARRDALEARLAALPVPQKGDRGDDGKDADMEAVARLIDERVAAEVEKRIAALPKAKDGESVHPDTIALMVREAADKLVAALPKPKDGSDGFGLEDFDVELGEDGRTLSLRFVRGEVRIERQVRLSSIIDRGVYRPETKYEKGDGVTFGGSFWIAQGDGPTDKPGLSDQWRLAVKRGRDGKDTK